MKGLTLKTAICRSITVLLLSASGCAAAQSREAAVLEKEAQWNDAYRNRDVASLEKLLADDFLITEEDGQVLDKAGYIALVADPTLKVEVSEVNVLKARMRGQVAIVTGLYHARGSQKGQDFELTDRFTDIWHNDGRDWKLLGSHYSLLPKPSR